MVKICPTCKKFVPTSSEKCPICGNTKLVVANTPAAVQPTSNITSQPLMTANKKPKQKKPVLATIFIIALVVGVIAAVVKFAPIGGNPLKAAIEPHVKEKISELKAQYGLNDLSYQFTITEQNYDTLATGEIIFISDDIANFEPKEQYELMKKIGTDFFSDLGTHMKFDGYTFMVEHGEGYSVWRTRKGDNYVAGYFNLEKNGREIYDNPDNDLDKELEDFFGMPYDEWLAQHSESPESEYVSLDTDDDDFAAAVAAAKIVVKDQLKAPSTAKFPWDFDSYTVIRHGRDFTVSGYVDSQNGFGAMIRSEWVAAFTLGDEINGQQSITNYSVLFT